ncbi:TM2 domain-containing protein [Actinoplanes sp. GCM10030250]|uniref:TM2 domain-containing protein n=1 Tax=Actinoplanes sp. GCM10030250 TaxID=3273376 RepID=UPI003622320A
MSDPLPEWEKFRVLRAESEYESVKKDPRVAFALWCAVGLIGGHRFYLGDTARSVAMLFTLGGLGVWTLVDGLFVRRRVAAVNASRRSEIMARYGILDAVSVPGGIDPGGTVIAPGRH